jgi:hypothetical protein
MFTTLPVRTLRTPRTPHDEVCGAVRELVRDALGSVRSGAILSAVDYMRAADDRVTNSPRGYVRFLLAAGKVLLHVVAKQVPTGVRWSVRHESGRLLADGVTTNDAFALLLNVQAGRVA